MKLRALILLFALLLPSVANAQNFNPWPPVSECQPGDSCCDRRAASSPVSGVKLSLQPAIVQIISKQGGQPWIGSGVLVASAKSDVAHVLTAAHVIPPRPDSVSIVFRGNYNPVAATVVSRDETLDLALLAISPPAITPYTVATSKPRLNDILWASGYAGATGRTEVVKGRLLHFATVDDRDDKEAIMLAGSVSDGVSGGAIVNANGELVGIISTSDDEVVTGTHCVEILKFLARAIGTPAMMPMRPGAKSPSPPDPLPVSKPATVADARETGTVQLDASIASIAAIGDVDTLSPSAGPTLLATALPVALRALGWSAPPSILALLAARFGWAAWRRRRAGKGSVGSVKSKDKQREPDGAVADAADEFLSEIGIVPRDDTEAKQFLRLSQLEGRSPVHDALVGRIAFDEIQNTIDHEPAGSEAVWAQSLKDTLLTRFNEMAPTAVFDTPS